MKSKPGWLDDSRFLITCTCHRKAPFSPWSNPIWDLLDFDGPKQQPEEQTICFANRKACHEENLHHHTTNHWPAGSRNDTAHVALPFYPSIPWWGPAPKPRPSNFPRGVLWRRPLHQAVVREIYSNCIFGTYADFPKKHRRIKSPFLDATVFWSWTLRKESVENFAIHVVWGSLQRMQCMNHIPSAWQTFGCCWTETHQNRCSNPLQWLDNSQIISIYRSWFLLQGLPQYLQCYQLICARSPTVNAEFPNYTR